jgi:hypothetical protein
MLGLACMMPDVRSSAQGALSILCHEPAAAWLGDIVTLRIDRNGDSRKVVA